MDLNGKSFLITGGTGSFGTQFIRYLLGNYAPSRVVVYSRDELKQYEQEMMFNDSRLVYVIGDVRDKARLTEAMDGVDVVVHAAAMKQVMAAERNPTECIRTNVDGAENVIEAALVNGVSRVVALSTDKAVNPVNLYGATKLCSDKLFVNANRRSSTTRFSVVRYGNVVGSRGSVVPYFRKLRPTGRLPITDVRMTRFWITLEEGARFVARCLTMMSGAEVFVARIPSMRIVDLASAIAPECKHDIIGIRPGEKLHEIMIPEDEARRTIEFDDYYVILPDFGGTVDASSYTYEGRLARAVPEGFRYASEANDQWVSGADLARLIPDSVE